MATSGHLQNYVQRKYSIMIFVTTGTQEPFKRLIYALDEIAPALGQKIIVQDSGVNYRLKHLKVITTLTPQQYSQYFDNATLIISHAGMGTIISALVKQKPIIIMPRSVKLKEHRNDHQLATAKRFGDMGYVHVAFDEKTLQSMLTDNPISDIKCLKKLNKYASASLIDSLREMTHTSM